jgi:hypothetical protein
MNFKHFFSKKQDEPQVDGFCVVNGKATDVSLLDELIDGDRPPTDDVKALLIASVKKYGFTDAEIATLYN